MRYSLLFAMAGILAFCTSLTSCRKTGQTVPKGEASHESAQGPETRSLLKFKTVKYVDRQGTGIEAFSMLIPFDWSFEGGIRWVLDNPGMPAVAGFRVQSANGADALEVFPNQSFFWTTNPMTLRLCPVGTKYFGAEVRQTVGPAAALRDIVIKRFKRNCKGLRIVSEKHLPGLVRSLRTGQNQSGASSDGASMRIEYTLGGMPKEEEIYAVVESFSFPVRSMFGTQTNTMWTVDYIFSFTSDRGKLNDNMKLFRAIVSSFKLNPRWFSKYNQVIEYLIQQQIRQIHSVGELSRIVSRTHDEISTQMMETYNSRQQVYDRLSENFDQYVRGVDEYYDPVEQRRVELPSGYTEGWVNGLGEYILTDNPNDNPNVGSTQTWHRMDKK